EKGHYDVAYTLGKQFLNGVQLGSGLPLNDGAAQQALDGAQKRHRRCRAYQHAQLRPWYRVNPETIVQQDGLRNLADDRHVQSDDGRRGGGGHQRRQRPRKTGAPAFRPRDHDGDDQPADAQGGPVGRLLQFHVAPQLHQRVFGRRRVDAEQVSDLADEDDDGDAAGKARNDGRRDEVDDLTPLEDAHEDDHQAGHDSDDPDALQAEAAV